MPETVPEAARPIAVEKKGHAEPVAGRLCCSGLEEREGDVRVAILLFVQLPSYGELIQALKNLENCKVNETYKLLNVK